MIKKCIEHLFRLFRGQQPSVAYLGDVASRTIRMRSSQSTSLPERPVNMVSSLLFAMAHRSKLVSDFGESDNRIEASQLSEHAKRSTTNGFRDHYQHLKFVIR